MIKKKPTTKAIPNPGSDAALDQGCLCPVLDNGHGRGYYGQGGVFVCNAECPLHEGILTSNNQDNGE